jgi:hypothetical protein
VVTTLTLSGHSDRPPASGGIQVMGRLTTVETVDDLIRSLEAMKLLFRP